MIALALSAKACSLCYKLLPAYGVPGTVVLTIIPCGHKSCFECLSKRVDEGDPTCPACLGPAVYFDVQSPGKKVEVRMPSHRKSEVTYSNVLEMQQKLSDEEAKLADTLLSMQCKGQKLLEGMREAAEKQLEENRREELRAVEKHARAISQAKAKLADDLRQLDREQQAQLDRVRLETEKELEKNRSEQRRIHELIFDVEDQTKQKIRNLKQNPAVILEETIECIICAEDVELRAGTRCGTRHFVCDACFGQYIYHKATNDERMRQEIIVVVCAMDGCGLQYGEQQILDHILHNKDVLMAYQQLQKDLVAQRVRKEEEARYAETLRRELERQAKLSAMEREAEDRKKFISETILTLKCPRCHVAFLDFEGCFALSCGSCPCKFCGWCLKDCGADAHACAKTCGQRYGGNGYYGTKEQFEERSRARRQAALDEYLNAIANEQLKDTLVALIRIEARDLGLTLLPPRGVEAVAADNLHQMQEADGQAADAVLVQRQQEDIDEQLAQVLQMEEQEHD